MAELEEAYERAGHAEYERRMLMTHRNELWDLLATEFDHMHQRPPWAEYYVRDPKGCGAQADGPAADRPHG